MSATRLYASHMLLRLLIKCPYSRRLNPPGRRTLLFHYHYTTHVPSNGPRSFLPPVQLRPYQETCLRACLETLETNEATRIGISLPTGSGKTTVFVALMSMLSAPSESPEATRALIIVNNIELAQQAAGQVKRMFPNLIVEIEQGNNNASGLADVTVATYQSLVREIRLEKFDAGKLKCIIIDEAHHAAAPSYRKILAHFDPNIRHPDVDFRPPVLPHRIPIIGFSATFSRHDGLALGSIFQRIVYHRDFLDMIKEQWLCSIRFTTVKAELNLKNVTINTTTGEFNPTSLAHVINTDSINQLVVSSWLEKASARKSTLVFCVNVSHLRRLTATFREAGIDARHVHAGTPAQERKDIIEAFRASKFPVLLNVAILTEGTDIPNIDCVVVAKPTRSKNIFAQMIGRGMRLSSDTGKTDCHIIDFVDSTSRISGIVSSPSLLGLNPDEVLDCETLESIEERVANRESAFNPQFDDDVPEPKSVTFLDYDNPYDLVEDASGSPHISSLSPYGWVNCGGDVHVLECMGKGYMKIEPTEVDGEKGYSGFFIQTVPEWELQTAFKKVAYRKPRSILTAKNLDEAVRGCDKYVVSKVVFGRLVQGLFRSASWRKQPATKGQKELVQKRLNSSRTSSLGKPVDIEKLTKGQAGNIITRLKHGAMARYAKQVRTQMKEAKVAEKERQRREREHVTVGPLHAGDAESPTLFSGRSPGDA